MTYEKKLPPIDFNLNKAVVSSSPIDFNLGNDSGNAVGSFDFKIDDVSADFRGLSIQNLGKFSAALDDCVGAFNGKYDSNVRRSLYSGIKSIVEPTIPLQSKIAFLQSNAVKNSVLAISNQDITLTESLVVSMRQENGISLENQKTSQQESTINIGNKTAFDFQQAVPMFSDLRSKQDVAIPLLTKTAADLQQLISLDNTYRFVVDDVENVTHIFNVQFNANLPPEFQ